MGGRAGCSQRAGGRRRWLEHARCSYSADETPLISATSETASRPRARRCTDIDQYHPEEETHGWKEQRRPPQAHPQAQGRQERRPAKATVGVIDYKDVATLRKFISERGKIRARRITGVSVQEQRLIATAVKNAREMALLPYRRLAAVKEDRQCRS